MDENKKTSRKAFWFDANCGTALSIIKLYSKVVNDELNIGIINNN